MGPWADAVPPYMAYGARMTLYVLSQTSRPDDSTRAFCGACEHSEFVHEDADSRRCLYSECGCDGFGADAG